MPFGVPDFHALHIEQGLELFYQNEFFSALVEFDQALQIHDSAMARYNRAHALLALGRYSEAWPLFDARYEVYKNGLTLTETGHRLMRTLPRWNGEPGHRVVLLHEAGFGDSIMFLRFTRLLRTRAPVSFRLDMPAPLKVLAAQRGPLGDDGDCWLSMFDLPGLFDPAIPAPPYLKPDPERVAHWRPRVRNGGALHIGIVWSSNTNHNGEHDNQTRSIALEQFLELLPLDGKLFSLQHHERAIAFGCGVQAFELKDFADVAALASLMDVIVSVDTAALHVAGAIDHPNVYAILPWAPTWRWHAADRWYPKIKLCVAKAPGDWRSAFAQIGRLEL